MEENNGIDIYTTLEELPIWNWYNLNKTGEKIYLMKNVENVDKYKDEVFEEIFLNLQQEYLDLFGQSAQTLSYLKNLQHKIKLQAKLINGDAKQINMINIINDKLEKLTEEKTTNLDQQMIVINKYMGFFHDKKIISVVYYKSILTEIENNGEAN